MLIIPGVIASSYPKASGAFESIATVTAGTTGITQLTFSGISQTYNSLQIRGLYQDNNSATASLRYQIRLNGDTGTNYAYHYLAGDGSTVTATGNSSVSSMWVWGGGIGSGATSCFGVSIVDIHDYTSTTRNKTIRALAGNERNGGNTVALSSGLWINTAAVTSITLMAVSVEFSVGSTFALYGIKGA
jgi:hypothetical protein